MMVRRKYQQMTVGTWTSDIVLLICRGPRLLPPAGLTRCIWNTNFPLLQAVPRKKESAMNCKTGKFEKNIVDKDAIKMNDLLIS